MELCKVCGAVARYILDNGDVVCGAHVPDTDLLEQPTACKVFCATRAFDREHLGECVTEWVRGNAVDVVDTWVAQSSDNAYHCISIVVFFRERT